MNPRHLAALAVTLLPLAAAAEITFYEYEGFRGRAFTVTDDVRNFERHGFNDKAQSIVVGSGRWEVCSDSRFEGECKTIRRGSYDSLRNLGMNKKISSVRRVEGGRGGYDVSPAYQQPNYDYYRRPREQVFEARVTSVRAVYGSGDRRCWTEYQGDSRPSREQAGAAIAGAIIGGVLGHQVGKGHGRDAATAAGALAGAAIAQRNSQYGNTYEGTVRRCESTGGSVAYWDVVYEFNDQQHHVQMSSHPGRSILVNEYGEPRQ